MNFLAPAWLVVAGVASFVVFGLHLLTRAPARPEPFPTARFIPENTLRSLARSARPTDLLLLAIRVLAVVLVGLALARPRFTAGRKPVAAIALLDRSPAADSGSINGALRRLNPAPDKVIEFTDLGAGLVRARREASSLSPGADSVRLVVISPVTRGTWNAAVPAIREQWPGRIELDRIASKPAPAPQAVETDAPPGDPIHSALTRLGRLAARGSVIVRRGAASGADTVRVERDGSVLVWWPARQSAGDTAYGVYEAGGLAVVGPAARRPLPPNGDVLARYADGEAAVTTRPLGNGCEREVGFSLAAGDMAIRAAGLAVVERLVTPCDGWTAAEYASVDSASVARLVGAGSLAPGSVLHDPRGAPPAWWALLLAAVVLFAERIVRRGTQHG